MYRRLTLLIITLSALIHVSAQDNRTFNQIGEDGTVTQRSGNSNGNFNKHNNDTTKNKVIPKGLYTWTIDRRFGDVIPVEPDTLPHLYMNTTFNSGMYGDYNTTGSNYTARLSRIYIDRPFGEYFIFNEPYSFVNKKPDTFLFMNTLSPYTRIDYDNCGDKTNGEDHIDAKFGVNVNKRLNFGFDLDYAYACGYYSNQNISHFSGSLFASYLGDRYQMHFFFNAAHQKASENGGITTDDYVTHPESFQDNYQESEIPTVLSQNWNRNDHQHVFLTHRYNLGFYRMVKMTDEEIKARKFAEESQKEHEADRKNKDLSDRDIRKNKDEKMPAGRPKGAIVRGKEPQRDSLDIAADTTRIKVDGQAAIDSLNRLQAIQDSIDATMKREYVPVTSFIHTLDIDNYDRIYQSYYTPTDYYKNTYYNQGLEFGNDSIYDQTKHFRVKNTLGIALLEGFNKWAKAGLKAFITSDMRHFTLPDTLGTWSTTYNEHNLSVGGQLSKTEGHLLHYNAIFETWLTGEDAGQIKLDGSADLNVKILGDTAQLAVKAYLHRLNPTFYQRHFHSKHAWWDKGLEKETRTRLEAMLSYQKTRTKIRVAFDNMKNYTYFSNQYTITDSYGRTGNTVAVNQHTGNLSLLTLQLMQDISLGLFNWESVITYQKSSNTNVLPVPDLNIYSNLYLRFMIAKVLRIDLGADVRYFTKYYAPDYSPLLGQFVVQDHGDNNIKVGGYPIVNVYANMHLKHTRFFVMMTHVNAGDGGNRFFTPHYPLNGMLLRLGVSWNFFN